MTTPVTQAQAIEAIQRARPFGGYGLTEPFEVLLAFIAQHPDAQAGDWIANVVRDVAELPDRNSPEDWPEAMLVTADELRAIILAAAPARSEAPEGEAMTMRIRLERTAWGSYVLWHTDCIDQRHAPPIRYAVSEKDRTLLECTACHRRAWLKNGAGLGEYCLTVEPAPPEPCQADTPAPAPEPAAHPPRVTALHTSMLDTAQKRLAAVDETLADVDALLDEPAAPAMSEDAVEAARRAYADVMRYTYSPEHPEFSTAMRAALSAAYPSLTARIAELEKLATAISRDCNNTANKHNAERSRAMRAEKRIAELERERDFFRAGRDTEYELRGQVNRQIGELEREAERLCGVIAELVKADKEYDEARRVSIALSDDDTELTHIAIYHRLTLAKQCRSAALNKATIDAAREKGETNG